ncbi:2-methylcitrate dehydratase PrpD [Hephaestia caeni]|uniref:2-methylcitrate dehydratase PrpD n=2 Tax=Hephaestia caeni TaxID=645617 RepID=A0A397PEA6_9SPHN|nr:2-methylcitrate dehydratase PrpD [Hephaestia caeni]
MGAPLSDDGFTTRLLDKLHHIRLADLDQRTQQAARHHLLDTVALIYGGSREETTGIAEATLAAARPPGGLPVLGRERRADVLDATFIMAVAGHSLEFDDGFSPGAAHPGVVTVPAALAVGNLVHASGEAVLEAIVAGYETITSIARTAHPMLRGRGFHPTATAGVFAAAAAAGRLLNLDADEQRNAFGLAASSAGGLAAFVQGGDDLKRLHVGHAAREGVFAALLAKQGAAAPPYAIEGPKGFFAAFVDRTDVTGTAIDQTWGITQCYIKPWPCCGNLLSSIDATLRLRREHGFSGEDVATLEVDTYRAAADRAATPWTTAASAQLSFPYLLATALLFGTIRLDHFSGAARANTDVEAMAQRFSFHSSDAMNARYPAGRPSRVKITLKDGRSFERDVNDALGSPSLPLSEDALAQKFVNLAVMVTNETSARALHAAWAGIAEVADIGVLFATPR